MGKSRVPKIDPCCTPLETHAGWENAFPKLTRSKSIYQMFRETNSIQFL